MRRTKKQQKGRKPKQATDKPPAMPVVRFGNNMFPAEVEAVVTWFGQFTLYSLTSPYYAYPISTNSPYDVDPALASTATQGLAELANIYYRMRAIKYDVEVDMLNNDENPIDVFVQHTNTLNGTTSGGGNTDLRPFSLNPFAQHKLLPYGTYAGTAKFTKSLQIAQVAGTHEVFTDDKWASLTNGTPTATTYCLMGAYTRNPSGSFNNGVFVTVKLRMHVRFYERKPLSS